LIGFFSGLMKTALLFFYHLTRILGIPNYGVAIILLTVSIKALLYPLTAKQIKSMRAMRDLGPEIKVLQEKYKDDKVKQQQEIAGLYKKAGVNPLAGCLPLLIQMPILTGIFYAIRDFSYVRQPSFLWIKNLAVSDPFYILPIVAALTTYISSMQSVSNAAGQQNKMTALFMPVFIGYMTMRFPAALGLYWVVSNLLQIAQQWLICRAPASSTPAG